MKGLNTKISVTYTFNICPISDVHTGSKRGESERGEFERGESERDMIGSRGLAQWSNKSYQTYTVF